MGAGYWTLGTDAAASDGAVADMVSWSVMAFRPSRAGGVRGAEHLGGTGPMDQLVIELSPCWSPGCGRLRLAAMAVLACCRPGDGSGRPTTGEGETERSRGGWFGCMDVRLGGGCPAPAMGRRRTE